ncbi:MAG: hypothetical protein AB7S54_13110 [Bacteroidales bacterium]
MRRNYKHYILILLFPMMVLNSFAQTSPVKPYYIDTLGKLFVSPRIPVNLLMGTKSDGSDAAIMQGLNGKGNPLYWNGHGPQLMTHLNLYIGRKIKFELFADGVPPRSELLFNKSTEKESKEPLYIAGGSIVEINAVDADAGTNQTFYSINGEPFWEYAEPLVFNNEGLYEIKVYSVDNMGNKEDEISRKFIIDSTPPTSTLNTGGDRYEDIFSGRSVLTIAATDSFGVKGIQYSLDSSTYTAYTKPIQTTRIAEGEHTIEWYSTDKVGNSEPKQKFTFYVDKTPPMVFEEIMGNSYMVGNKEYSSGRSQLKIAAVDNKSGVKEIYYSLNDGSFNRYEKPVMLSDIMGTMSVKSYAVDNVNNRSQSGASTESFTMPTIDITGPTLTYKLDGPRLTRHDTLWVGPSTKIQVNATDKEAGVNRIVYSIDKQGENEYTEPFTIKEEKYHLVKCTAFDNVDNLNFLSFELGVDNIAPEIFYHFSVKPISQTTENGENVSVFPPDVKIFLAATDNLCGNITLNFSMDKGKQATYRNPIENIKPGIHTLTVNAVDWLDNSSVVNFRFKVE